MVERFALFIPILIAILTCATRRWNMIYRRFPTPLPAGYETTWCPGVDATVMPLCMPSDVIFTRALEDGTYDIEIVEAERRFWVSYKHVHGIKFQVA